MATLTKPREEHGRASAVDERRRANERLEAAMEAEQKSVQRFERSVGTPQELHAYMQLREARRQVSACGKWLEWVEDEDRPQPPAVGEVPQDDDLDH